MARRKRKTTTKRKRVVRKRKPAKRGRGRPTNRPNRYAIVAGGRTVSTSGSLTTARGDLDRAREWGTRGAYILDHKTGEEWS